MPTPVQVIQDEPGAVHGEEKGRLAADPSTRACDYRHTPIEEGARGLASREVLCHDRDPVPVRHGRLYTLARKEEKAMHATFPAGKLQIVKNWGRIFHPIILPFYGSVPVLETNR